MTCHWCEEPILAGEQSPNSTQPMHHECLFRAVAGSAAHILHECSCYGGTREDPPGLSRRAAAGLAFETYRTVHPEQLA